jgi:hypothetical protein
MLHPLKVGTVVQDFVQPLLEQEFFMLAAAAAVLSPVQKFPVLVSLEEVMAAFTLPHKLPQHLHKQILVLAAAERAVLWVVMVVLASSFFVGLQRQAHLLQQQATLR